MTESEEFFLRMSIDTVLRGWSAEIFVKKFVGGIYSEDMDEFRSRTKPPFDVYKLPNIRKEAKSAAICIKRAGRTHKTGQREQNKVELSFKERLKYFLPSIDNQWDSVFHFNEIRPRHFDFLYCLCFFQESILAVKIDKKIASKLGVRLARQKDKGVGSFQMSWNKKELARIRSCVPNMTIDWEDYRLFVTQDDALLPSRYQFSPEVYIEKPSLQAA